ncbi:DUF4139 domain-containing protein [Fluviicola sp.]|jgi:uncharacterized protein (TIGR02231 family)|uniref:DUF4139 domain-containing protein n=1 Tax=Fluviicola sp. TaxID=1917219 RepID=UPI0028249B57|nr:DUF4139 domain-containing protein [Fluviicola sp.]MDR0802907.1 DUF4139 domain-containing protein [Fluviicola sp.]
MKKVVVLLLAILPNFYSFANDKEVIKSAISEVTVYTSGAQVYRKANFNVKPGITELIIEGVSPNIDPKSLQVKAFGNVVLLDSKYQKYYPKPETPKLEGLPLKIRKDINMLQDSMDNVAYDIKEIQDEIDVLNTSKNILSNNGAIRGQGKVNDSVQLLKQVVDYYQLKMNEINKKLQQLNKRIKLKNTTFQGMSERMKDLQNYQSSNTPKVPVGPVHRIVVTVQSKEAVAGRLVVSYLASGASWVPSYDIRGEITEGKVNLAYKASVQQNTGESWDNVQLTLSTNDPYQNKIKPDLHPWYVDYYNFSAVNGRLNTMSISPAPSLKEDKADSDLYKREEEKEMTDAETAANFTTVINRVLSAEYKIDLPYTIESNGDKSLVLIRNVDLAANYRYYTVPKLDPGVFLVAEVVKLEDLQLVPANANIFFDGTYIGETYIDPTAMNDTLKLSLGKDPNILAKRILLKKDYKEKIIGNDIERTYAYEISVKNLKANAVELVIEDQIPVTTNGEIAIDKINTDKADYDKTTGKLTWTVNLKTKATEKMTYSFKIKYPKDRNVIL